MPWRLKGSVITAPREDGGGALHQVVRRFEELDILVAEGDAELQLDVADEAVPILRLELPQAIVIARKGAEPLEIGAAHRISPLRALASFGRTDLAIQ
jgi:hypothetical protein